ncbi:HNH endonuclease signature motif containing protein [Treponema sp. JC4]|uniref:HNH endonuclease n=1 Tax=Treponema sp. JC4 TaxID=1124982 RepID=UPI0009DAF2C3
MLKNIIGICFISGVSDNRLLIASHIKPWSVSDNKERLDTENGFLLNVLYDKLFDLGIISFTETGDMLISKSLKEENIERLHITKSVNLIF